MSTKTLYLLITWEIHKIHNTKYTIFLPNKKARRCRCYVFKNNNNSNMCPQNVRKIETFKRNDTITNQRFVKSRGRFHVIFSSDRNRLTGTRDQTPYANFKNYENSNNWNFRCARPPCDNYRTEPDTENNSLTFIKIKPRSHYSEHHSLTLFF